MREPSAFVYEVFSGVQGEGPLVGERQIFVRFCACNLRCRYCDTPAARRAVKWARLELSPGSRRFERIANPMGLASVVGAVRRLQGLPSLHHSVSLTGGEPLVHVSFLCHLLPALHRLGLENYIETNGTLPAALAKIVSEVDIVAMDVKLPSATGQPARYATHRKFLKIASRQTCIVKVVVTRRSSEREMRSVGRLVHEGNRHAIVVLQPVTPAGRNIRPPTAARMLELQRIVKTFVPNVRVIPQVHKLMGQR